MCNFAWFAKALFALLKPFYAISISYVYLCVAILIFAYNKDYLSKAMLGGK